MGSEGEMTTQAGLYIEQLKAEIANLKQTALNLGARLSESEQDIIRRDDQIFKLETKVDELRGLLQRWHEMKLEPMVSLTIDDYIITEGAYLQLKYDTTGVLK